MLVSIGVTAYNRPQGLKRTLECLVNQTYPDIEIIVSDNGSLLKEVSEIASEFASRDPRIRCYKQAQNKGPNFNFKFVLEEARGEYFMWASDDDWWAPGFVEKILHKIRKTPGAVAGFCNINTIDELGNNIVHQSNPYRFLNELTSSDISTRLKLFIAQYEGYGKGNLFNSIIRTDVIKNVPFDLIVEKVPSGGADLSMIFFWLMSGNLVMCEEILRSTTVGNVKHSGFDNSKYENEVLDLFILYIYIGKLKFYWNTWSDYLFFYFYLTRTAPICFFTKSLLYLTISKKILLFMYDLVCYNVVLKGFNIFQFLKRKQSLVQ